MQGWKSFLANPKLSFRQAAKRKFRSTNFCFNDAREVLGESHLKLEVDFSIIGTAFTKEVTRSTDKDCSIEVHVTLLLNFLVIWLTTGHHCPYSSRLALNRDPFRYSSTAGYKPKSHISFVLSNNECPSFAIRLRHQRVLSPSVPRRRILSPNPGLITWRIS